jgi:hypothetical protein
MPWVGLSWFFGLFVNPTRSFRIEEFPTQPMITLKTNPTQLVGLGCHLVGAILSKPYKNKIKVGFHLTI